MDYMVVSQRPWVVQKARARSGWSNSNSASGLSPDFRSFRVVFPSFSTSIQGI